MIIDLRATRVARRWAFSMSICAAAVAVPARAQQSAGSQPTVDLRLGTLNGRPLAEWTLDAITDSLGRPTAVTSGIGGVTGTQLHYHSRGLSLWFQAKEKDPSQRLWMATIYLAKSWDRSHTEWYEKFAGSLNPTVDGNWKQSRIETEFAALNPKTKTVEDGRKEAQAAGLGKLGVRGPENDFVYVTAGKTQITFALEPNTKFLERIILRAVADTAR